MSHPYWPQPRYLYHRAQPHGVYPSAMGEYYHGSFTRRRAYALPDYVASEATGLEGDQNLETQANPFEWGTTYYGGFGDFTVGNVTISCSPETLISKLVSYLPTYPFHKVPIVDIKSPIADAIKRELLKLSNKIVEAASKVVENQRQEFRNFYKMEISYNIEKYTGLPQELTGGFADTLFDALNKAIGDCKAYIPKTLKEGEICSADMDCVSGLVCKSVRYPTPGGYKWVNACLKPEKVQTGFHIDPGALSMLAQRPGMIPMEVVEALPAPPVYIEEKKPGIGTAAVIGAAALAALMLMR